MDIAVLYKKYYRAIYRYIYTLTNNKEDTEDIIQNTFIKALRGLGGVREYSCIKTWLFRIAHNECVSYYRVEKSCIDIDDIQVCTRENLEKQLLDKEDAKKILIKIMEEKEPVRTLLILRLLEELPFGQIGEILTKSEVWCRVTFYRKKREIIEALEEL